MKKKYEQSNFRFYVVMSDFYIDFLRGVADGRYRKFYIFFI